MVWIRNTGGREVPNYDNVTYPPKDQLKDDILRRRRLILAEMRHIEERRGRNLDIATHRLRANLLNLYDDLYSSLTASLPATTKKNLYKKLNSTRFENLRDAWEILSDFLYKKNLTAFDNSQNIDFNDMEAENEAKGQ